VAALVAAGCRVIGADPREDRRTLALEQGCEAVFDPTRENPTERGLDLDPHGPRVSFECAGVPESLQQAVDACGHGGVVGILGVPMAPVFLLRMMLKEQRAFSIQGPTMDSMRRALDLVEKRPQIAKIITATVPLSETAPAFEGLAEGDGNVKILVAAGE
jgi:threonine dehydrogenase-like Zn-dependent dehydrogenase